MKSFLEKVAEHLAKNHATRIQDVCIVLPNRRASLFLRKGLANIMGKTIWAPQVFSVEDFIQELSDDQSINSLRATFELYEVHKQIEGKHAQPFDEFYKWGSILVQDFNELDLHLVNAENLYSYLSEVKSLAEWKLDFEELSSFQSNYLKFFKSLYNYYLLLNESLSNQKQAYNGKLFRDVAENIEKHSKKIKWKRIIFAGFNALSLAEEKILFSLKELNLAEFLWDVDKFYLAHESAGVKHEAGLFFRRYFKKLKNEDLNWQEENLKNNAKNIQIYGVPKQIGQAKFCGQLLHQNQNILSATHKSAIILADENLLFPVLNSIPSQYAELNVTMGLPLSTSPLFGLLNQLFKTQIYSENKKNTLKQNDLKFRFSDISRILRHSVINNIDQQLFKNGDYQAQSILKKLKETGAVDFSLDEINQQLITESCDIEFAKLLFSDWENRPEKAIDIFQKLIELLRDTNITFQKDEEIDLKIELEQLYQFTILINKIEAYVKTYGSINSIKILHSIFLQICNTQKLPLYGEPLKGLQVMGMLESRNLDFENLIILSVNENILPSSGKQMSFIPFELKREFKIPTYREKNAIFAYHFFRLIQRAKNINILYNSQPDLLAGGDKSRFIHQITNELSTYNPNIQIKEKSVASIIKLKKAQKISISKNEQIFECLDKLTMKGISASSLNSYIRCQLQFYFSQIAKLGELEEDTDSIDAASLGTVIHEALHQFFKPHQHKILNSEVLKLQLKDANQFIAEAFRTHFSGGNIKYGKNFLVVNVAQELFKNFIKFEINEVKKAKRPIVINSLEKRYAADLQLKIAEKTKLVKFHGFIDRVQTANEITEIIDYKTGTVKPNDLNIKSWEDLIENKKFDKAFQLLLYSWIFDKASNQTTTYTSGIYPVKRISSGLLKVKTPNQGKSVITPSDLNEFEIQLSALVHQIYDPSLNFEQTDDISTCKYCAYRSICNK